MTRILCLDIFRYYEAGIRLTRLSLPDTPVACAGRRCHDCHGQWARDTSIMARHLQRCGASLGERALLHASRCHPKSPSNSLPIICTTWIRTISTSPKRTSTPLRPSHADTLGMDALAGRTVAGVRDFSISIKTVSERMEKIQALLKTGLDFTGDRARGAEPRAFHMAGG